MTNQYRLVYHSYFSQNKAKLQEWWTLEKQVSFLGWKRWAVQGGWQDSCFIPHSGDRKWAGKIAKHYGINEPIKGGV